MSDEDIKFESEELMNTTLETDLDLGTIVATGADNTITVQDVIVAVNATVEATDEALELANTESIDLTKVTVTAKSGKVGKGDVVKAIKARDAQADNDEDEDEDEDSAPATAAKNEVLMNFKEDGTNYRIGDEYKGKNGKTFRAKGLIA